MESLSCPPALSTTEPVIHQQIVWSWDPPLHVQIQVELLHAQWVEVYQPCKSSSCQPSGSVEFYSTFNHLSCEILVFSGDICAGLSVLREAPVARQRHDIISGVPNDPGYRLVIFQTVLLRNPGYLLQWRAAHFHLGVCWDKCQGAVDDSLPSGSNFPSALATQWG
jgi:hypothetical protein